MRRLELHAKKATNTREAIFNTASNSLFLNYNLWTFWFRHPVSIFLLKLGGNDNETISKVYAGRDGCGWRQKDSFLYSFISHLDQTAFRVRDQCIDFGKAGSGTCNFLQLNEVISCRYVEKNHPPCVPPVCEKPLNGDREFFPLYFVFRASNLFCVSLPGVRRICRGNRLG